MRLLLTTGLLILCGCWSSDIVSFDQTAVGQPHDGLRLSVSVDTGITTTGSASSFGSAKSNKPYGIRLNATDMSMQYKHVLVTELTIEFDDGEPAPLVLVPVTLAFARSKWSNSGSQGIVHHEGMVLGGTIPGAVDRDVAFTLYLKGEFVLIDGVEPFELKQKFTPRHDKRTVPIWEVWKEI